MAGYTLCRGLHIWMCRDDRQAWLSALQKAKVRLLQDLHFGTGGHAMGALSGEADR